MEVATHQGIDRELCGEPQVVDPPRATVRLVTTERMAVDDRGLVHGGFLFGLADHAAMLAVNDPNVVLGSSSARFLKPVVVDDEVVAEATVEGADGRRHVVGVEVSRAGELVMSSEFVCYVLDQHVLDPKPRPGRAAS